MNPTSERLYDDSACPSTTGNRNPGEQIVEAVEDMALAINYARELLIRVTDGEVPPSLPSTVEEPPGPLASILRYAPQHIQAQAKELRVIVSELDQALYGG